MSFALRNEDFEGLFSAPPAPDWTAAFQAVEDLNDFRRITDKFEADTQSWVSGMTERIKAGITDIENKIVGLPRDQVREFLIPILDEALSAASDAIDAHATPFHEIRKAQGTFDKLRQVSGPAGKFIRKQINRIEDARVKRHNSSLDLYYGLMAFRSEIEEDGSGGPSFSDPTSLRDFLRKQVA